MKRKNTNKAYGHPKPVYPTYRLNRQGVSLADTMVTAGELTHAIRDYRMSVGMDDPLGSHTCQWPSSSWPVSSDPWTNLSE